MVWGLLDDKMHDHPKVVDAGNEAAGAWMRMVSYCCDHRQTQGVVPRGYALNIASPKVIAKCVKAGLLDVEGDTWRIHDFGDWSGSTKGPSETPASLSLKRSEAGKRGAAKRWHADGDTTTLPMANGGTLPLAKHSSSPLRSRDQEITAASETRSPRADAREPPNRRRSDPTTQAASESFDSTPGESESGTRLVAPVVKAHRALAPPEPLSADLEARRQAQLRELESRREEFEPAAGAKS